MDNLKCKECGKSGPDVNGKGTFLHPAMCRRCTEWYDAFHSLSKIGPVR